MSCVMLKALTKALRDMEYIYIAHTDVFRVGENTKDWVVFFSYISFFPSLLSGPIDRAGMLVPQLEKTEP
jgi:D-alanyl-lipoteichoic acid acyltransferase DltB (MBOAT superfamily)